jgi:hypothetical protein
LASILIQLDFFTHCCCSFLYILVPNDLAVYVLNVSTAGNATTVQNFNFESAAQKVGVTPSELSWLALFDLQLPLFSIPRPQLLGGNDDFRELNVVHIFDDRPSLSYHFLFLYI